MVLFWFIYLCTLCYDKKLWRIETLNKQISYILEKAGTHKTLIQNFSYLSALQIFNMLIPLITYPYLIRVLGKETYGLVVFAQAVIGYLVILVGFGFNMSATKEVSIHRNNKEKLSEIVSSVLLIKGALFFLAFFLLSITLYFIHQAKGYENLFFLTMWMCLYEVIFPIWYFQGIEQMKFITLINSLSKGIFLVLIFLMIKTPEDYLYVPIINGFGALIAGSLSLYILYSKHKICFRFPQINDFVFYLKESIPLFISNISGQVYVKANKVIVGAFLGMGEVAYYDLAEKVINVLKIPQGLISQAIFPKVSLDKNRVFLKKAFKLSMIFNISIFVIVFFCSKQVVQILGGDKMENAIDVLRILSLTVPIVGINSYLVVQHYYFLLDFKKDI